MPLAKVDPIYFEKTYYLGPDKGGEKAYRLLADALAKAEQVALARFVMRGKQQLVLIRAAQDGLMMHTMYFADEVRSFGEIEKGRSPRSRTASWNSPSSSSSACRRTSSSPSSTRTSTATGCST